MEQTRFEFGGHLSRIVTSYPLDDRDAASGGLANLLSDTLLFVRSEGGGLGSRS